jgi:hypothetical protein
VDEDDLFDEPKLPELLLVSTPLPPSTGEILDEPAPIDAPLSDTEAEEAESDDILRLRVRFKNDSNLEPHLNGAGRGDGSEVSSKSFSLKSRMEGSDFAFLRETDCESVLSVMDREEIEDVEAGGGGVEGDGSAFPGFVLEAFCGSRALEMGGTEEAMEVVDTIGI